MAALRSAAAGCHQSGLPHACGFGYGKRGSAPELEDGRLELAAARQRIVAIAYAAAMPITATATSTKRGHLVCGTKRPTLKNPSKGWHRPTFPRSRVPADRGAGARGGRAELETPS